MWLFVTHAIATVEKSQNDSVTDIVTGHIPKNKG